MAKAHDGEIVNADSMQVYDVLRVLTARPSMEDMEGVAHHLYGHVRPGEDYSTGRWLDEASEVIEDIRARGRLPVIVGGTGLYFRALTGGLSQIPPVPSDIRDFWRLKLELEGVESLHRELARRDPEMAARLRPQDRQRLLRAVEVFETTGQSLSHYQKGGGRVVVKPENALRIAIEPDRSVLHQRINARFAKMLEDGAMSEVKTLISMNISENHPAMKAIGVRELMAADAGEISLSGAVEKASAATRQYAKRQLTWIRNQLDTGWLRLELPD